MTAPAPSSRWGHRAACAGRTSPDPSLEGVPYHRRRAVARDYCQGCPVMAQCAADAVEHRDRGIIRGGIYISDGDRQFRAARRTLRWIAAGFVPLAGGPS